MPKKQTPLSRVAARTRDTDTVLREYLSGFGLSETEVQKLTPLAARTLRNVLKVMNFQGERRVLVRNALSSLLGAAQQSVNVQGFAMAILKDEDRFSGEVRVDMLQLASRLHRFA